MSILPQLESDLLHAADRRLAGASPARGRWHRRWRRRRVVLSLAFAALVLMGAGGGALLLAPGRPVTPAYELPAMPTVGLGRPLASSLALLPLRAADPAGGPPWGMRVIRTTRGLACIQAGRVLDGRLGGIGIGYAFKGDGRFHPFSPADAISEDSCATLDRDGRAFQPGAPAIVTADGLPLAGENLYPYQRVHCDLPGEEDWGVRCPQADLREIAVGLLGPDAASIQVSAPGRDLTIKPVGPDGAYLIVLPAPANINSGPGAGPYGALHRRGARAGAMATLTVTYSDGSQCEIPAYSQKQTCSPKGLDVSTGAPPTGAKLKTRLRVRYRPLLAHSPSLLAQGRGGKTIPPSTSAASRPGPALVITFRAPAAAPSISSGYDIELQPRAVPGCSTPATIVAQPTQQTLAAGQQVQIAVSLENSCRTTYDGRVFFVRSSGSYSEARTSDHAGEGPLYEVIAGYFCCGRGSGTVGATVGTFRVAVP
ncbi:MAG: hypothetical protein ACLQBY_00415 [Solirubrobacteraceae bacterium]